MAEKPTLLVQLTVDEFKELLDEARSETKATEPDRWMNVNEAAVYLGNSPNALHKLTAERRIPFHQDRPKGKLYFKRSELDAWRTGD